MVHAQVSYHFAFRAICHLLLGSFWAVLALVAQNATAASTILSTGFESPYVPGLLQNQPTTPPKWATAGSGGSSANVETTFVKTGAQAVRVDKVPSTPTPSSTDRRWAVPTTGFPTQRFVIIDWDMAVSQSSSTGGFGPFFGMESYDGTAAPYVLGSLGVDASTGDVLYQAAGTGELTETVPRTIVTFGQWNHFRLVLDFAGDTYSAYFNGALKANPGFVDGAFGLNHFTDADIATLDASADPVSIGLSASAYFDNLVVRDGLLGDYDIDGDVDNADYTRWRTTFGNSVSPAGNLADGNRNGIVDAGDYVIWRASLGANVASGAGLSGNAVPEPAGFLMLLASLGILCLGAPRRRLA
jgi:hypothetical protein